MNGEVLREIMSRSRGEGQNRHWSESFVHCHSALVSCKGGVGQGAKEGKVKQFRFKKGLILFFIKHEDEDYSWSWMLHDYGDTAGS